jgi:hypothetical protein
MVEIDCVVVLKTLSRLTPLLSVCIFSGFLVKEIKEPGSTDG